MASSDGNSRQSGLPAALFEGAGLASVIDDGFADLGRLPAQEFLSRCAQLRFWPRLAGLADKAAGRTGLREKPMGRNGPGCSPSASITTAEEM